jgi:hypothetical protein
VDDKLIGHTSADQWISQADVSLYVNAQFGSRGYNGFYLPLPAWVRDGEPHRISVTTRGSLADGSRIENNGFTVRSETDESGGQEPPPGDDDNEKWKEEMAKTLAEFQEKAGQLATKQQEVDTLEGEVDTLTGRLIAFCEEHAHAAPDFQVAFDALVNIETFMDRRKQAAEGRKTRLTDAITTTIHDRPPGDEPAG